MLMKNMKNKIIQDTSSNSKKNVTFKPKALDVQCWPQQALEMVALDQAPWAAMLRLVQAVCSYKGNGQSFLDLLELQPHALAETRTVWVNFGKPKQDKLGFLKKKTRQFDEHNQSN